MSQILTKRRIEDKDDYASSLMGRIRLSPDTRKILMELQERNHLKSAESLLRYYLYCINYNILKDLTQPIPPIRYIRQHCSICDCVGVAWRAMPDAGVAFCDACFNQRPADICYHCGLTCRHKFTLSEDEDSAIISSEQDPVIPPEFFEDES